MDVGNIKCTSRNDSSQGRCKTPITKKGETTDAVIQKKRDRAEEDTGGQSFDQ